MSTELSTMPTVFAEGVIVAVNNTEPVGVTVVNGFVDAVAMIDVDRDDEVVISTSKTLASSTMVSYLLLVTVQKATEDCRVGRTHCRTEADTA
ncbi:hypothetical protein NDU88_002357 [Pleurodeles waltl]|uniref:Uncharacterized protein n=1 Tax=Pleurodeles waltl TaxID=8319 RepID=A0AAV7QCE9_PLEWA|nr:hypothetical protein NDU88_002357 [Pleurodeles waltl]